MPNRKRLSLIRNIDGASAVEFTLLAPFLLMILLGTITMFDLYRNRQRAEKATFTTGDILSRQSTINATQLNSLYTLLGQSVSSGENSAVRVSSIIKRANNVLELQWSKVVGPAAAMNGDLIPYDIVPDIAENDSVIVAEVFVPQQALVAGFGISTITFKPRAAYRPRFVSAITFQN